MNIGEDDDQDFFQDLQQDKKQQQSSQNNYYSNKETKNKVIKKIPQKLFKVSIIVTDFTTDLNIIQSQYYLVSVEKQGNKIFTDIRRRYSDFDILFDILFRSKIGFIFPAFPQKTILSYVKTKVSATKDKKYLEIRMKILQRFMNKLLNRNEFNCETCVLIKNFFSDQSFDILKKTEKQRSIGLLNSSWNKLRNYFKLNRQNISIDYDFIQLKKDYEIIYEKNKQLLLSIKQQISLNEKILDRKLQFENYKQFEQILQNFNPDQKENLIDLDRLDFQLYCQNQDILMVEKVIQYINQFKSYESNSKVINDINNIFNSQCQRLYNEKQILKKQYIEKIHKLLLEISRTGRMDYSISK